MKAGVGCSSRSRGWRSSCCRSGAVPVSIVAHLSLARMPLQAVGKAAWQQA